MFKPATYVSVWDCGTEIHTSCEFNSETNEVQNIESTDEGIEDLDVCEEEHVVFNGEIIKDFCDLDNDRRIVNGIEEEPFTSPEFLAAHKEMTIDAWHQILEGTNMSAPKEETFYVTNDEEGVKKYIQAFEEKYNKRLKYRRKESMFYLSYLEK